MLRNESSVLLSLLGTKVPPMELSFLGTKVLEEESFINTTKICYD